MKIVDVRGLQHHLGRYLDEVEQGEVIEIRRRKKIIARIVPSSEDEPVDGWPDLVRRLERIYPKGPVGASAGEQLYRDRDER